MPQTESQRCQSNGSMCYGGYRKVASCVDKQETISMWYCDQKFYLWKAIYVRRPCPQTSLMN